MASYYPPTNFFQNINFNNDFYAEPNNGQGVKLDYANSHYLFSTDVSTSTAITTFFSGSIGIGTVGNEAGSLYALKINAINSLQVNGMDISNIYVSSNVIPNFLSPYDKIVDRQNAITSLSNIFIPNSLLPYDKIVDRQNADIALQIQITSNIINISSNTADIITANGLINSNKDAITANGRITTDNTNAITGCLKNTMVQAGNIGLFYSGSVLNVVSNPDHFIDVSILATNRQFNLAPTYANLPTTKNNKITWNAPLNYNTGTDTASIDLSSYYTSVQTNNTYVSSNSFFNNIIPNYVTNIGLSNQFYISSNTVANLYISSNTFFNKISSNYVTNTSLSNMLYISSNTVANLYISSNVFSNNMLKYVTNTSLSNQLYISSNTVANIYVSSNVFNSTLVNYVTNLSLIDQLYTNELQYPKSFVNQLYTNELQYPPQLYDSSTAPTTTTFLNNTFNIQTITINNSVNNYGIGTYNIYTSSVYSSSPNFRNLLDYNLGSYGHWALKQYTASGIYQGLNYIISSYLGDWVIIKLPAPIILTRFRIYLRGVTYITRCAGEWKCYGSMDGVTFNEIPEGNQLTPILTTTDYSLGYYEKVLATTFTSPYLYIGWCVNKLAGADTVLNMGELQIFGRELISNNYISSNVLSSTLLDYTTNTSLSNQLYISSNTVNNLYISSNLLFNKLNAQNFISSNVVNNLYISSNVFFNVFKGQSLISSNVVASLYISSNNFYRGSNIYLEKPVQIMTNSSSTIPKNALMVGDGGRLLINQEGTSNPYACSRIGTADTSSSGNFTSNANITLFEAGYIQYNANPAVGSYGHNFNSSVQTGNLYVGGTITVSGTINALTLTASNIGVKSPVKFTTSRQVTSGGDRYYMYDIDLRLYTKSMLLGSYNYRQFRIRTWEDDGDFENIAYLSQNKYDIFMSDKNGLSLRSYSYYDNQNLSLLNVIMSHTLFRNSFNYISYASRLVPVTVYMIIEDLL